ncbi:MAG: PQQ-binding-like beta-propeller repeat protein [Deltaproteobacteria bacterium]|nr:PQQ-binding-like beta-propeller repeat protein [Deltaproteobacteria bacterium]
MRGVTVGKILLSALLLASTIPSPPVPCGAQAPPPLETIEGARGRLRFLSDQAALVDRWVEENREAAFAARYPSLSRAPRGQNESEQEYRARQMRVRMAVSELKAALRAERKDWLAKERQAILSGEIREDLPARLGPYDAERGEYPLLLGFGWPAALKIKYRVPERESDAFANKFPRALSAGFRINEKGEASLVSLEKGVDQVETVVQVAPPGPRLVWQGSHESWVTAIAFRPDGSQVASGGGDGAICVWDTETGNRLFRLADVEMALSIAYSPDGSFLATGGADSFLRLRSADTGKETWRARAGGMIFSVAFSPDGRHIATGDDGGALRVWNARSGKEILRSDLGSAVRAVVFTPEGKAILAGGEGNFVVLWEMASGRQLWRKELGWQVLAAAAGGRGGLVAVGGTGEKILALREADGVEAWSSKGDGELRAVQFDAAGRLLVAGSGYTARVFLAEKGDPRWAASVGSPVRSLAFGPSGMKLAVGSADFGVRLFEVDEGDRLTAAFSAGGCIYIDRDKVPGLFR